MNILFRFLLVALFFLSLNSLQAEEISAEDKPTPPPPGAVITGQAIIELRVGVKQYLKGMGLALIPESSVAELKDIRNKRWLESASRLKFNAGYYYLDLKSIGYFASQQAVLRAKTDAEGKYSLEGITKGNYRIYAQYKSRYAAGYWLIPVKITSESENITVNINNENLEEIYNRQLK
jgi:hypothetical protein